MLQNSEEVKTSLVAVLKAIEAFSPELTSLVADFFAFTELLKKYFSTFLMYNIKKSCTNHKKKHTTTYVCITSDGMKADISENGFIEIMLYFSFN